MLHCVNNSVILRASLELLSDGDYNINNEFEAMCTRFGLDESQLIALVTTLDISLLDNHHGTIWDGLNYYSMACMDDYKNAYIESLYKTDLMDARIELLCDDLKEYIKCNSCINVENKCRTFKDACNVHHDECVKYLLNNPQKHDVKKDRFSIWDYENTNIIDYICVCGGSLDVVKYLFEIQKKDCTKHAIDYACKHGNLDVIEYLFDIQKKDCTIEAMYYASCNGHLDVVKYLFEIKKKDCTTDAIDWAIKNSHLDVVIYLFEIQNKDCTIYAVDWAVRLGHLDIVKYLFENQKKDCSTNATDIAISSGRLDVVKYLFEIQKKNCTGLGIYHARTYGYVDIVDYFEKKHNVDYQKSSCIMC